MNEGLDEQQTAAIEALQELKRICDKHGIHFLLLAGSTLGAVRHGGMIPWDDDIDVGLRYKDWYLLRTIIRQELSSQFQYVDDIVEQGWPRFYGKLLYKGRGCVDIFLIVKWTCNPVSGYIHWGISKIAKALYQSAFNYNYPMVMRPEWGIIRRLRAKTTPLVKKVIYFIPKFLFDATDYVRLTRWNEKYYERRETNWYINIYSAYSMRKEMLRADWIEKISLVNFEGNIYETVGDTKAYLTHLYGNYMELPPEEKRIRVHSEVF